MRLDLPPHTVCSVLPFPSRVVPLPARIGRCSPLDKHVFNVARIPLAKVSLEASEITDSSQLFPPAKPTLGKPFQLWRVVV
jgi:hypothetical protein